MARGPVLELLKISPIIMPRKSKCKLDCIVVDFGGQAAIRLWFSYLPYQDLRQLDSKLMISTEDRYQVKYGNNNRICLQQYNSVTLAFEFCFQVTNSLCLKGRRKLALNLYFLYMCSRQKRYIRTVVFGTARRLGFDIGSTVMMEKLTR